MSRSRLSGDKTEDFSECSIVSTIDGTGIVRQRCSGERRGQHSPVRRVPATGLGKGGLDGRQVSPGLKFEAIVDQNFQPEESGGSRAAKHVVHRGYAGVCRQKFEGCCGGGWQFVNHEKSVGDRRRQRNGSDRSVLIGSRKRMIRIDERRWAAEAFATTDAGCSIVCLTQREGEHRIFYRPVVVRANLVKGDGLGYAGEKRSRRTSDDVDLERRSRGAVVRHAFRMRWKSLFGRVAGPS